MKTILPILTILLLTFSCQTTSKKTVEGDLYFKLIDLRFFDAPDSVLSKIETDIKTLKKDTLTEQDKRFYDMLQFMFDRDLVRKSYIRLRKDDGAVIMVFLDLMDYDKIKNYNHNDLIRDNKKIRIKAEVDELKSDSLTAYKSLKIISIDKIDGMTYWDK